MENEFYTNRYEAKRTIKDEPWDRLFNPLIMDVFIAYIEEGGTLFGITGDLDNLGVYVARKGRPCAENLVDLYNQATRNFLRKWFTENGSKIKTLAFIPSGEEIFVVGIASDKRAPRDLFDQLRGGVMEFMRSQKYIKIGDTSASFGGKVFDNELDPKIKQLVNDVNSNQPDEKVFPTYLELLSEIRRQTAIELDRQKFKDILGGDYPVELRQLVLTRMLLYKKTTRQIVESLNQLPREDIAFLLDMLGNIYGVEPGKEDAVDNFLNGITGGKNGQ
jgi:hypothetical protein